MLLGIDCYNLWCSWAWKRRTTSENQRCYAKISNYNNLAQERTRGLIYACAFHPGAAFPKSFRTASLVGSAGIAPLSVTVTAPQAFANKRASLNSFSSCREGGRGKGSVRSYYNDKWSPHKWCLESRRNTVKFHSVL